MQWP